MKIVLYRHGKEPIEVEADRVRVKIGLDHFEFREQSGLFIRLEEHDGTLSGDLAVFPETGNTVRLRGGVR